VLLPQLGFRAHQNIMTINLQGIGIDIPGAFFGRIGPFGSMDARLILTQDLVNIAGIRAWQSFSSRRDASRFNVDNSREVVALNVVGAYLQALRAKASRDTLNEQTRLATELYDLTASRFRQGVSSELDANRAKQQVNSLEQQRQEAEQSYVEAKLNLAELLQATITADFEVTDEAAYGSGQAMDRQATIQSALSMRADYRAAESEVRAAELRIKAIKATRLPTVHLLASDGQSGDSPVHNVNTYTVGGSVDIPIFTGGRTGGEVHEAEGSLINATALLDKSRSQIESDVLTAISGVEWALKEFQTSAENVVLSRQELDLTRARFLQGVADNTEVVNAQDRLTRANDARIRAQFTLGLSRANLARSVGSAEKAYRK
jgi:outer membrane protein TolC